MNLKLLRIIQACWLACAGLCLVTSTNAQVDPPERISKALSNTSHPARVKVSLQHGGITVKGYEGKEVVVEARLRQQPVPPGRAEKLEALQTGLKVTEENNLVTITVDRSDCPIDLAISVPFKTSLNLATASDGAIVVEKVEGEIDASNENGPVSLASIGGVAIANARNGPLLVSFTKLTPNKPMSFSAVGGDIDLRIPGDAKAKVKLAAQNGRAESDFDIGLKPEAGQGKQAGNVLSLKSGGKELTLFSLVADLNGGGAELSIKTVNGNIFLRKSTK